jgi:hypothetical protein
MGAFSFPFAFYLRFVVGYRAYPVDPSEWLLRDCACRGHQMTILKIRMTSSENTFVQQVPQRLIYHG